MADAWHPTCYVCGRFVAMEAYDVFYDYYAGAWEEGYTACPEHGGPSKERVADMRVEQATYEKEMLRVAAAA